MSLKITYKGDDILDTTADCKKKLDVKRQYLEDDVIIEYASEAPTLITKNIIANGTYNASSDNADGYSSVTVNVQGWASPTSFTMASDVTTANEFKAVLQSAVPSNGYFFVAIQDYGDLTKYREYHATGGIVAMGTAITAFRHGGNSASWNARFESVEGSYSCKASAGDVFYVYTITPQTP